MPPRYTATLQGRGAGQVKPPDQQDLIQMFLQQALQASAQQGAGAAPAAAAGMNPLAAYGISQGIGLVGGAVSYLSKSGQRAGDKGRAIRDRKRLEGLYDQDVFDPMKIDAMSRNAIYDDVRTMGGQIDKNIGLDTGTGRGYLYEKMLTTRRKALVDMMLNAALAKSSRQTQVAGALFNQSQQRV